MDIADKFLSWTSQDTSTFPYPLPYTSPTKESDFTLQLAYGLHNPEASQTKDIPPLPLEINTDTPETLERSPNTTTSFNSLLSPTGTCSSSPTLSEARGSVSSESSAGSKQVSSKPGQKNTKRAVQNRAAQRRFRERRDEQNRTLREKAEYLQERYEALGERLDAKSDEVNQLERKNGELNSEIQDLRRRWRTMVLLLQRPKSLQFLSMFVGDAGLPLDQLDGYVRCLDALIFPEKS
ncbi:hypothetical protein BJX68DRAFT_265963 [Aspergillus pseudodeflectus]|uniref:BZIP domain-containing protein n=1 Tax=Aspergillus pseudodeflectus TaxID=176178 RepID=A0ABR4KHH0_9EURO